jgi:hypothetical protein
MPERLPADDIRLSLYSCPSNLLARRRHESDITTGLSDRFALHMWGCALVVFGLVMPDF